MRTRSQESKHKHRNSPRRTRKISLFPSSDLNIQGAEVTDSHEDIDSGSRDAALPVVACICTRCVLLPGRRKVHNLRGAGKGRPCAGLLPWPCLRWGTGYSLRSSSALLRNERRARQGMRSRKERCARRLLPWLQMPERQKPKSLRSRS